MNWLSIQANQLTGSIPLSVFNISRIENIAFTMNSLSGNLSNGLCNGLPFLKGLYLSGNKLHGHMPTSLSNCSPLQVLSLSKNEFDGPIHSEIGRLSNLQLLCLGHNHFTGEIPKDISNLIELEQLNLQNNSFSGSLDMEIFNISGLREISLSWNNLSGSSHQTCVLAYPTLKSFI
ncbi:probable leucine-rich repeat receptor-like protein kinase At5g63930 [Capsicum annuum]|uniref:probable leucine-rich repeat receptor-like protein kinase At5g63930 n=1 Tax=Capsicum annuum TaxID=4072 RepID=UPI001FB05B59|nr:probable leucine-rich repeat receptor-like protein kinase At5g63930 [Capsicum annuum]